MSYLNSVLRLIFMLLLAALQACGGGKSTAEASGTTATLTSNVSLTAAPENNIMTVAINAGPVEAKYQVNRLLASVTICQPGSSNCATVTDILVDSGSTGLRLLSSSIPGNVKLTNNNSAALVACQQYLDGTFSWGPVASADIILGDAGTLRASNVPIQIIADPAYNSRSAICSTSGEAMTSIATLGANGILGIGINVEDCGNLCTRTANNNYYFNCTGSVCNGRTVTLAQQIQNPISSLPNENTGFLIALPSVGQGESVSQANGYIAFGIGTRTNNKSSTATVLTTRANNGYIGTSGSFGLKVNSFLDTGSNGLYFDDASLASCVPDNGFYCPPTSRSYTATLTGSNGSSKSVTFSIDNANTLFASGNHVLPTLGGPINSAATFDWGLPFFFGRTVLVGIEGKTSTVGNTTSTGPFFAF